MAIRMKEQKILEVDVITKGPGPGRESLINALTDSGITVRLIKDTTPIPHNGVKPLQRKRIIGLSK